MSSPEIPHLQDEDLLRLLDGEIPDSEASLIQSHMAACWTCRTRMEEFESAIGEYVRYRGSALKPMLPPPPQPWNDLRPKFEEADRALARERVVPPVRQFVRQRRTLGLRPGYWVAAAACLIVGLMLVARFEHAPAVKAAELLQKASAVQAAFEPNRRVRIKTRRRVLTRPALLTAVGSSDAETADLKNMFDTARFSWEEPLSARSYSAWHDHLLEKRDQVETIDQDESAGVAVYVIKTSTLVSTLRKATITLRARDLRPMREMLEFTADTVEITDIPEATGSEIAESPAKSAPARAAAAPSRVTEPGAAMSPIRRQLEVFAALHRIGADLGEPIEIRRSGSELLVIGTGLTAAREEQLKGALSDIPGVVVRLDEATANAGGRSTPADRTASVTAPTQSRLQALLGSRESAEDFTNRALDASDMVMARVHALRALARAFPAEVESGLGAADSGLLAALLNDHVTALAQRLGELQRILKPVITQPATSTADEPATNWQRAVESLFAAAQQVDESLNAALAGSGTAGDDSSFRRLGAALARLQSQFANYEKAGR